MEIILLVVALLILGKTENIGDKNELRFIVGLVLGITYFFIWPYVYYYLQLLSWSEMYTLAAYVSFITITMLAIRPLLAFKSYEITLAISFCFFIVFWAISYNYNIEIKDKLAEQADYFSAQLPPVKEIANFESKEISSPTGSYTVTIPALWKEHKHKSTGLPYFKFDNNNEPTIEFRPKCYDKRILNLTNIVEGGSSIHNENEFGNYQCYRWRDDGYACKITISNYNSGINRIRWLGANNNTERMLELDFIIQNSNENILNVIDSIFESIRFNEQTVSAENCAYSIAWF